MGDGYPPALHGLLGWPVFSPSLYQEIDLSRNNMEKLKGNSEDDVFDPAQDELHLDTIPPRPDTGNVPRQNSNVWLYKHSLTNTSMSSISSSQDTVRDLAMEAFSMLKVTPSIDSDPGNFSMETDRKAEMMFKDDVHASKREDTSADSCDMQGNVESVNVHQDSMPDGDLVKSRVCGWHDDRTAGEHDWVTREDSLERDQNEFHNGEDEDCESSAHYDTGIETDADLDDLSSHSGQGIALISNLNATLNSNKSSLHTAEINQDLSQQDLVKEITFSENQTSIENSSLKITSWDSKCDLSATFVERKLEWSDSDLAGSNEAICGNSLSSITMEASYSDVFDHANDDVSAKSPAIAMSTWNQQSRPGPERTEISDDSKETYMYVNPFAGRVMGDRARDGSINLDTTAGSLEIQQILECVNHRLHSCSSMDSTSHESPVFVEGSVQERSAVDVCTQELQRIEEEVEDEEEAPSAGHCMEPGHKGLAKSKDSIPTQVGSRGPSPKDLSLLNNDDINLVSLTEEAADRDITMDAVLDINLDKPDSLEDPKTPIPSNHNIKTVSLSEASFLPKDTTKIFIPIKRDRPQHLRLELGSSVEQSDATVEDTTEDEAVAEECEEVDWMGASVNSLIASANENIFFSSMNMPVEAKCRAPVKKLTGLKENVVNAAIHDTVAKQLHFLPTWNSQESDSHQLEGDNETQDTNPDGVDMNCEPSVSTLVSTPISPGSLASTTKQFLSELELLLSGKKSLIPRSISAKTLDQSSGKLSFEIMPSERNMESPRADDSDELTMLLDNIGKRCQSLQQDLAESLARENFLKQNKLKDDCLAVQQIERFNKEIDNLRNENHKLLQQVAFLKEPRKTDHLNMMQLENIILQLHCKIQDLENNKLEFSTKHSNMKSVGVNTVNGTKHMHSRGIQVENMSSTCSDVTMQVEQQVEDYSLQTSIPPTPVNAVHVQNNVIPLGSRSVTSSSGSEIHIGSSKTNPILENVPEQMSQSAPDNKSDISIKEVDVSEELNGALPESAGNLSHLSSSSQSFSSSPAFLQLQRNLACSIAENDILQMKLAQSAKDTAKKTEELKNMQLELSDLHSSVQLHTVQYNEILAERDILTDKVVTLERNLASAQSASTGLLQRLNEANRETREFNMFKEKCQRQAKELELLKTNVAYLQKEVSAAAVEKEALQEKLDSVSQEVRGYLEVQPSIKVENVVLKEKLDFVAKENEKLEQDLVELRRDYRDSLGQMDMLKTSLADTRSEKKLLSTELIVLREEYDYMKKVMGIMEKHFKMDLPSHIFLRENYHKLVTDSELFKPKTNQTELAFNEELKKLKIEYESNSLFTEQLKHLVDSSSSDQQGVFNPSQASSTTAHNKLCRSETQVYKDALEQPETTYFGYQEVKPATIHWNTMQESAAKDLDTDIEDVIEVITVMSRPQELGVGEMSSLTAPIGELKKDNKLLWMLQEVEKELQRQDEDKVARKETEPPAGIQSSNVLESKASSTTAHNKLRQSETQVYKDALEQPKSTHFGYQEVKPAAIHWNTMQESTAKDLHTDIEDVIEIMTVMSRPQELGVGEMSSLTAPIGELKKDNKLLWMLQEVEKELQSQDEDKVARKETEPPAGIQSSNGLKASRKLPTGIQSTNVLKASRKLPAGVQSTNVCKASRELPTGVQSSNVCKASRELPTGVQSSNMCTASSKDLITKSSQSVNHSPNNSIHQKEDDGLESHNQTIPEKHKPKSKDWFKQMDMKQMDDDYEVLKKKRLGMLLQAYTGYSESDVAYKSDIPNRPKSPDIYHPNGPSPDSTYMSENISIYKDEKKFSHKSFLVPNDSDSHKTVGNRDIGNQKASTGGSTRMPTGLFRSSKNIPLNDTSSYPMPGQHGPTLEIVRAKSWLETYHAEHHNYPVAGDWQETLATKAFPLNHSCATDDRHFHSSVNPNSTCNTPVTPLVSKRNTEQLHLSNMVDETTKYSAEASAGTSKLDVEELNVFGSDSSQSKSAKECLDNGNTQRWNLYQHSQNSTALNSNINIKRSIEELHHLDNTKCGHNEAYTVSESNSAKTLCTGSSTSTPGGRAQTLNHNQYTFNEVANRPSCLIPRDKGISGMLVTADGAEGPNIKVPGMSNHESSGLGNKKAPNKSVISYTKVLAPDVDLVVTRSGEIIQRKKDQISDFVTEKDSPSPGKEKAVHHKMCLTEPSAARWHQYSENPCRPRDVQILSPQQRRYADNLANRYTQEYDRSSSMDFSDGTNSQSSLPTRNPSCLIEFYPVINDSELSSVGEAHKKSRMESSQSGFLKTTESGSHIENTKNKLVINAKIPHDKCGSSHLNETQRLYIDELINKYTKHYPASHLSLPAQTNTSHK